MIRALVAEPSVSSVNEALDMSNAGVCEHLAGWLEDLGFATELVPVPDRPGKYNVIGRLGSGDDGLVLSGHTDTVPWDDGRWQHDPFAGAEVDGRLYGLGSADMKSFLATALTAAQGFRARRLKRPLTILGTADEESTMSGARALVDAGLLRGAWAVIGEPTGMRPVNMHKGVLMEAIVLRGRSGHSSDPSLGNSALEGMVEVMDELRMLRTELAARYPCPDFAVDHPTLNLGRIEGGDNPNRICAECELQVDLRLTPGMTVAAARAELHDRVRARLEGSGLDVVFRDLFAGVDPLATPKDGTLVKRCEALAGHPCHAVSFGTEGPFLTQLGMETLIMGPGSIDVAHQPNEYLDIRQAERSVEMLGRLVQTLCVDADEPGHARP